MGSIFFIVTAWAGMGIGWAKPVPMNHQRMRNIRQGGILTSLAGPASNILLAMVLSLILGLPAVGQTVLATWGQSGYALILSVAYVNAIFGFFNLLPLPPLDGSWVVASLLPNKAAQSYQKVSRFGFLIIIALIFLPGATDGEFPNFLHGLVQFPALKLILSCLG
jgi:Zn-dependent protease